MTTSLPISVRCPGSSFEVGYNSVGYQFQSDNVFSVQLSDALGRFNNQTTIGTITSINPNGNIPVTIPMETENGVSYGIRVISSNPPNIGGLNEEIIILQKPTIALNANTFTASPALSYQWYFNDTVVPNATENSFSPEQSGTVKVLTFNSYGVACYSDSFEFVITEIADEETPQGKIFPNPFQTFFELQLPINSQDAGNYHAIIVNSIGQLIDEFYPSAGINRIELNEYPNGFYILILRRQRNVKCFVVIKQK